MTHDTPLTNNKIVAIVQARMASSRLPGKVLLDIADQPMLSRVVERAQRARTLDQVVVATTTDPSDDAVADLCARRGYPCTRGSQRDVLDRYYQAALCFEAGVVVRLTADCPLIDPDVIDQTVSAFLGKKCDRDPASVAGKPAKEAAQQRPSNTLPYDFAANRLPPPWKRTYPIGLDVEVCTFAALERAWREAEQPHEREHVMPYLYEQPGRFRTLLVHHDSGYGSMRWTVDTPEDLELIRQVYTRFEGRDDFSWLEVLALFQREPELAQINAQIQHKSYRDVDERP